MHVIPTANMIFFIKYLFLRRHAAISLLLLLNRTRYRIIDLFNESQITVFTISVIWRRCSQYFTYDGRCFSNVRILGRQRSPTFLFTVAQTNLVVVESPFPFISASSYVLFGLSTANDLSFIDNVPHQKRFVQRAFLVHFVIISTGFFAIASFHYISKNKLFALHFGFIEKS